MGETQRRTPAAAPAGAVRAPDLVRAGLGGLAAAVDPDRAVVVTDGLVRKLFGSAFPPCPVVEVPRGEAAKELRELELVYEAFAGLGLDRGSTVVAIGGGSVSDLAGFAAATWLRGLDFAVVPTTLLAMVDAALGGKNGVDFGGRKNLVGTFHQPRLVLCDVSLLASLPDEQFASGMAEAIKHGVIEGGGHFAFLEEECRGRAALDEARLDRLVGLSQTVKLGVVGRDPRESGERRKLNLGHTLGHAIEAVSGLPHGHAVAAGLATAFRLAAALGSSRAAADLDRVTRLLEAWDLPASIGAAYHASRRASADASIAGRDDPPVDEAAFRAAVASLLSSDKKRSGDEILFALPVAIGEVRVEQVALRDIERLAREAP